MQTHISALPLNRLRWLLHTPLGNMQRLISINFVHHTSLRSCHLHLHWCELWLINLSPIDLDLILHSTGMMMEGKYSHMDKLLALNSCWPTKGLIQVEGETGSPLNTYEWKALCCHPDGQFVQFVIIGLQQEFRVGINCQRQCSPATTNFDTDQPQIILEHFLGRYTLVECYILSWDTNPKGFRLAL